MRLLRQSLLLLALALPLGVRAESTSPSVRRTRVVEVVDAAQDAVVSISTDELVRYQVGGGSWFDNFFRGYYEPPRYAEGYRQASLGSGAVVSPDGYVVTNNHVIQRGTRIRVLFRDGRELEAKLVGTDPASDLAVLKVEAGGPVPSLRLGARDDVLLGETVIAIGNPFGLSHTVSTGIVSTRRRNLVVGEETYFDFLQTDASINPGNSGGPLINLEGEVIGINTAIYGEGQGIGFAIPAGRIRRIVDDLIDHGRVRETWLGLRVAQREDGPGLLVRGWHAGSPVEKRVRPGDVLLTLDGRNVGSLAELRHRTREVPPGQRVRLGLRRGKADLEIAITTSEVPLPQVDALVWNALGLSFRQIEDRRLGPLVVVEKVRRGTRAAKAGLIAGDLVRGVAGGAVSTLDDLRLAVARAILLDASDRSQLPLSIQRGRQLRTLAFHY